MSHISPFHILDELCKCLYTYVNHNNWLTDADHHCTDDCEYLSLFFIGPPNPDYNPDVPAVDRPLFTICSIVKNYSSIVLVGHTCKFKYHVDADGITHLFVKCRLTCKSPSPKQIGEEIFNFMNPNQFLGDAKYTCRSRGRCLILEIVGR